MAQAVTRFDGAGGTGSRRFAGLHLENAPWAPMLPSVSAGEHALALYSQHARSDADMPPKRKGGYHPTRPSHLPVAALRQLDAHYSKNGRGGAILGVDRCRLLRQCHL